MTFWKDVRDLRDLIRKEVDAGEGGGALKIAMDKQRGVSNATAPERHPHGKLFVLSFLAGMIWQGSKRKR